MTTQSDSRKVERERCARIAESEPVPGDDGEEMPPILHTLPIADVVQAAVRATKQNIAKRIRAGE